MLFKNILRFPFAVRVRIIILIVWLLVDSAVAKTIPTATKKKVVTKKVENKKDEDKCGIYFAQSTIPGAGYGCVT
jgi:hypothetical protein